MKKTVWIWNHYATGMFFQQGGRHHWFAKYLQRMGYRIKIFCAATRHGSEDDIKLDGELFKEDISEGIDYVFVKARAYEGNGISRILNMTSFYYNVQKAAKEIARRDGAPDVVLASSVHPLTLVAGIRFGKKYKIPCICEVRDLWPETLVVMGRLEANGMLAHLLYRGEKWIYEKATALIFTMEGGSDYIIDRGWEKGIQLDKVFYINNGVDLETYNMQKSINTFYDKDVNDVNSIKLGYIGSIRESYNIGRLVEVSQLLEEMNVGVKIVIYGDGPERKKYEKKIQDLALNNVIFKGKVDKKYIPFVLSKMDFLLFNDTEEMEKLVKYGFSQNKFFEYLASGKPIISTFSAGKYDIINKYKLGIAENITTNTQYVACIQKLLDLNKEEKAGITYRGEKLIKKYDFKYLTKKLENVIEQYALVDKGKD